MQALPSLTEQSSTTRTNDMSIWPGMECGTSYTYQTPTIHTRIGILFYISLYFPWNIWNSMYRVLRKALRQISMWFRTLRGHEYTWGVICQMLFLRRYWHFWRWQKPYLKSMLPPWINFSLITTMLWRRLLNTWIVSNTRVIQERTLNIAALQSW